MKNIVLVVFCAMQALFVFPSNAIEQSCPAMTPGFLNRFNRVMVDERFVFISDFMKFCHRFEQERWLNMTNNVICFGAHGSKFASVVTPYEGFLTSLKLVHVSGQVICDKNAPQYNNKWGCSRKHPALGNTPFNVVITAGAHDGILYPSELFLRDKNVSLWYELPDVDPNAPEIVLGDSSYPYYVTSGQEIRIWHGRDLRNSDKENGAGKVCFAVKGWFMV